MKSVKRFFVLSLLLVPLLGSAKPERVNVLFLVADDLNTSLSGYGHPDCKTPNLDRLAVRGVSFENLYCQFPLCGPSRASFMTGRYPYDIDILSLPASHELRKRNPGLVTLPQLFRQNGYRVGRVSKVYHMGIPKDIQNGTPGADDPESWDSVVNVKSPELDSPGKKVLLSPKNKGSQGFWSIQSEGGDLAQADGMAAEAAIRFLEAHKDQPFFLAVGFVRPHVPLVAPQKYYVEFDPEKMTLPKVPANDLDDIPPVAREYKTTAKYGMDEQQHREIMRAYYAAVLYVDTQVGRVLDKLKELGLADNTVVVFTSDHGYLLGEHFKWQKRHLFDEADRVPFIISVPWMKKTHGAKVEKIAELVDLYPTLAELAGLECPPAVQGESLVPLLRDPDSPQWKKQAAYTFTSIGCGESIRTERWRYNRYPQGGGEELYDCKNDPGQFTNLVGNPEYAEVKQKLAAQLDRFLDKTGHRKKKAGRRKIETGN